MNTLTAAQIAHILQSLDGAENAFARTADYSTPRAIEMAVECARDHIKSVRQTLLRASLSDVRVEFPGSAANEVGRSLQPHVPATPETPEVADPGRGAITKPPVDLDARDIARCMSQYGPTLGRCAGGRLMVVGYVCPHCSSSSPRENCEASRVPTVTKHIPSVPPTQSEAI